ncbi:MAG: tRNA (N(6)-L-threonylcarbamoyladenosine(37)-C(2))-methylthiotransferase MtaB [Spirochaetia bacterium]|nr:tRNA (N(6)-L-threonylcarbamoyladenosine(37)-C(2))-methylthiotransferase MtaB [Spirochaetia bacterium]
MNVCVYTLGCRLNQCESEAIADSFSKEGFTIVDEHGSAELYIVNTCTVTSKAEQKARRMIRKFAKQAIVLATGCYAQVNADELAQLSDNVLIVSLQKKAQLLHLAKHLKTSLVSSMSLLEGCKSFSDEEASVFDYDAESFSYHSRAYLKVQDGCDNACAYCRVHIARGKAVSLPVEKAVERALALEGAGFQEIMLTGVNLTMYDHLGEGLGGLLQALQMRLSDRVRLRLSSLEPDHIDERLLVALEDFRMQPHFHIPVQSGSDSVLRSVDRHYTIKDLKIILDRLKSIKDDPFLAADIITGLPAETEQDFEETYQFVLDQKFSALHVFPFSPRPDTPLFHAKSRVPESVRDERAARLRALSKTLHTEYKNRQVGKRAEAVLQSRKGGSFTALSGNYLELKVIDAPLFAKEGMLVQGRIGEFDHSSGKMRFFCDGDPL